MASERPGDASERQRRQRFLQEASMELLVHAREGDEVALEVLCQRYLPSLRRWASGRLPYGARDLLETDDLVQDALIRTMRNLGSFDAQREGALLAYLRQAVRNRIRDEIRRVSRRPTHMEVDTRDADRGPSPLEQLIGRESIERYERALERLKPVEREALIARIEMGFSFEQVAQAVDKPSADAARMTVNRAMLRLAEEMTRER